MRRAARRLRRRISRDVVADAHAEPSLPRATSRQRHGDGIGGIDGEGVDLAHDSAPHLHARRVLAQLEQHADVVRRIAAIDTLLAGGERRAPDRRLEPHGIDHRRARCGNPCARASA